MYLLFVNTTFGEVANKRLVFCAALLLSYQRGGWQLCRLLVSSGASLSCSNIAGETLFNSAVASRALLAALLESLSAEPPWAEGEKCMECAIKYVVRGVTLIT